MDVFLKFLGGAKSVTGSKYLLEVGSKKILIDCGLFQGKKELRLRNWYQLPLSPEEIDAVVLTHAHLDHSGYLPRLVKDGFKGPIYCTSATRDLVEILLLDAGKLQEEEAEFAYKRGYSKHSRPQPLFSAADAKPVLEFLRVIRFDQPLSLTENLSVTFRMAGHILGAALLEFDLQGDQQKKKLVFSGDLGRGSDPVMYPPTICTHADVLVVESTYGDRKNPIEEVENDLANTIIEAAQRGGLVLIPAFAVGRTQNLIYYFHHLIERKRIPKIPIYIDSPMAISVTDLYERHAGVHKIKVEPGQNGLQSLFDDPNIHFCNTAESSKALNDLKKPGILISASGMCTGGRILHHLYHRLGNENDTLLFVGFQAEGTRGRDLLEGKKTIRIFGEDVPVKCHIKVVNGLSAHADQQELLEWLGHFGNSPKFTFLTHGELSAATALQQRIMEALGWRTFVPEYLESFELFTGI
ncbi:MAG: MBL fold metallo-hydrolase RNA specificity domain-containing protein [Cyclobacteriaceae bacterium]